MTFYEGTLFLCLSAFVNFEMFNSHGQLVIL